MNLQNLDHAIAIMKRAGKVNMHHWQSGNIKQTEESKHICGSAACFAGWIGVSPEWAADGGTTTRSGEPFLDNGNMELESDAKRSLAVWFDLPANFMEMLMFSEDGSIYKYDPSLHDSYDDAPTVYSVYNVPFKTITSVDIVNTLTRIRDLGFVAFLEEEIVKLKALDIEPVNEYEVNLIERFKDFIFEAKKV